MEFKYVPPVSGLQLRQLRLHLGVSQEKLTAFIATTSKSIRKYEINGLPGHHPYVVALVELAERKNIGKAVFAPDLPRAPNAKRWHRFQPRRHVAYGTKRSSAGERQDCGYWLWLPGHRDHLQAIQEPPTGFGDMWLERIPDQPAGPSRRRYRLEALGKLWVDDIDISQKRD